MRRRSKSITLFCQLVDGDELRPTGDMFPIQVLPTNTIQEARARIHDEASFANRLQIVLWKPSYRVVDESALEELLKAFRENPASVAQRLKLVHLVSQHFTADRDTGVLDIIAQLPPTDSDAPTRKRRRIEELDDVTNSKITCAYSGIRCNCPRGNVIE